MANTNAPFGLMPVRGGGASNWPLQVGTYYIPSDDVNAFYVGSPVKLLGTTGADAQGVQAITAAAAGDAFIGSIVNIEPVTGGGLSMVGSALNLEQVSIPATKTRAYYVQVADDPNQIFLIQGDGTATNQTAAKANYNADMTITAPSPSTLPQSATVIDSSTITTTSTRQLALMGLYPQLGMAFGAYGIYKCKINSHQYANARTGV